MSQVTRNIELHRHKCYKTLPIDLYSYFFLLMILFLNYSLDIQLRKLMKIMYTYQDKLHRSKYIILSILYAMPKLFLI